MTVIVGSNTGITFPDNSTTVANAVSTDYSPGITSSGNTTTIQSGTGFIGSTGVVANGTTYRRSRIITSGLVMWLDSANESSYPGTGTTWTDLSGKGNNGTLNNGVAYSSDNFGSLVFDGTNDHVSLATTIDFPFGASAGTVSAWGRASNLTTSNNRWLIAYGSFTSLGSGRILGTYNDGFIFGGYGDDIVSYTHTANTWFNLVGVYNGTSASLYVNGVLAAGPTAKTWNTEAGWAQVGSLTSGQEFWNGNIAQVAVYNRALTADEVLQNFESHRGRFGI